MTRRRQNGTAEKKTDLKAEIDHSRIKALVGVLRAHISRIDALKTKIATDRDELRAAHDELSDLLETTDILDSADHADDELGDALRMLEHAVDTLSQYL